MEIENIGTAVYDQLNQKMPKITASHQSPDPYNGSDMTNFKGVLKRRMKRGIIGTITHGIGEGAKFTGRAFAAPFKVAWKGIKMEPVTSVALAGTAIGGVWAAIEVNKFMKRVNSTLDKVDAILPPSGG